MKIKDYVKAFVYAIRPFETMQHFAMTAAGFTFSAYIIGIMNISAKTLLGSAAVLCFLCHVLSYNNYATFDEDMQDETKQFSKKFGSINKRFIFWISVIFFAAAVIFSLILDPRLTVILILLMAAWAMYTHPVIMLKRGRFVPYILDMITMPVLALIGCWLNGFADWRCILFSVFFGFMEIGGHLNHMTIDYSIDLKTRVETLAVKRGPKFTFIMSTVFFIIAPLYFLILGIFNILPFWIAMIFMPGAVMQTVRFARTLKSFSINEAIAYRTLYRIIYLIEAVILEIYMLINIDIFRIFK